MTNFCGFSAVVAMILVVSTGAALACSHMRSVQAAPAMTVSDSGQPPAATTPAKKTTGG